MSLTAAVMIFLSGAASATLAALLSHDGELIKYINNKLDEESEE